MSIESLGLKVECYAGYRGEQLPRRLFLGTHAVMVKEIIDQWIAPGHRYFKIQGDDGGCYIIRHDEYSQRWELTMYDARPNPDELPAHQTEGTVLSH